MVSLCCQGGIEKWLVVLIEQMAFFSTLVLQTEGAQSLLYCSALLKKIEPIHLHTYIYITW